MRPGGQRLMATRLEGDDGGTEDGRAQEGPGEVRDRGPPAGSRKGRAEGLGGLGARRLGSGAAGAAVAAASPGQPGRADSRSPTRRIRTSFFMSAARRGRPRPARMERTPLARSAQPAAPLSPRCGRRLRASPTAPPEPRPPGPAAPPPQQLPCSRAGTAPAPPPPAPRVAAAAGRRGAARDKRFRNANALCPGPTPPPSGSPQSIERESRWDTLWAGNLSGRVASLTPFLLRNSGRRSFSSKVV